MIYRILSQAIKRALKTFPAVVVTGPRQSGKTTLLRNLLKASHQYFSLESPDIRTRAQDDPVGFLSQFKKPVILDEFQYVPALLSYIKTLIDEKKKPGFWVLTGSQNFVLMQDIAQSLAGRVATLSLLPFSLSEKFNKGATALSTSKLLQKNKTTAQRESNKAVLSDIILRGFFPEVAVNKKIDKDLWCGSYITTYLERDVRNLSQVGDLNQFERFLKACAVRTGQILNLSEIARDIGISVPTAKKWLSLLETGYQVFLLYPYYRNIGKRLIKSPKIYFNDPALAVYLLGIRDKKSLFNSPQFGSLFETLVVVDFWKRFLHFGFQPAMYYLKTRDGLEVDLVLEDNQKLHLFEIKGTATITPKHLTSLIKAKNDFGSLVKSSSIISSAESGLVGRGVKNYHWLDLV
ncbi:ATP-binding protein [Candidatus Gribaldobacteria bacterium]|nr:ATP-binding protein [Candidatus Gribaldobacteria bacterium]